MMPSGMSAKQDTPTPPSTQAGDFGHWTVRDTRTWKITHSTTRTGTRRVVHGKRREEDEHSNHDAKPEARDTQQCRTPQWSRLLGGQEP